MSDMTVVPPDVAGPLIACLEAYHMHRCKAEAFVWARMAASERAGSMAFRAGNRQASRVRMRHSDIKDNLRMALLDASEIVFTTLSSAAVQSLE